MKFLVLLVCVLASVVKAQKEVFNIPPAILQAALTCMAETGLNPEVILQLSEPSTYDKNGDKRAQKYINCTFSRLGYAKKNGHVRVDKIIEVLTKDLDNNKRAAVKKVIEECNKENGADPYETTYKIFGCFIKTTPVKFSIANI